MIARLLLIIFLFCGLVLQEVDAMSLFGVGKTCVFSELRVRLLLNGNPIKSRKVIRSWDWNKRRSDVAITDENGYVVFPAVYESSVSRLLPAELVIGQQLAVEVDGVEKVFWSNAKREPEENAEYGGSKFDVVCDLNDGETLTEDYGSLMVTMCKLIKE